MQPRQALAAAAMPRMTEQQRRATSRGLPLMHQSRHHLLIWALNRYKAWFEDVLQAKTEPYRSRFLQSLSPDSKRSGHATLPPCHLFSFHSTLILYFLALM